ncbi:MAG: hypothetical protein KJZ91_28595 [Myxococcales bacterium]|nr:hypothetical protein [Myxococcales bacterium]
MRRPALALAATAALTVALAIGAGPSPVAAQPSPYGIGDERAAPPAAQPAQPAAAGAMPWSQPPAEHSSARAPEQLSGRPSGFWTSTRPARGGAYRWRIMAAGGAVLAVTVFFVARLLLRTRREPRATGAAPAA